MKKHLIALGCLAGLALIVTEASAATLSWTIQTVGGESPSLAFDAAGRPAIAYRIANQNGFKYTAFNGTSWAAAQTVDATGYNASLAFNPATGKAQIAFVKDVQVDGFAASFINFATLDGAWSVETVNNTVKFFDPTGRSPNLAIDATGKPHIGWGGPNPGNADYSYSTKVGGNWVTELVEGPAGPFTAEHSSLALKSDGVPAITHNARTLDDQNAAVYRTHYTIRLGGVWSVPEYAVVPVVVDGSPQNIVGPRGVLRFDKADVPHLAYVGIGAIKYATRASDGTWSAETVVTSGSYLSMVIHPVTGVPFISFLDGFGQTNVTLKVAHKTSGSWEVETIESGLSDNVSPSMALDPTGTTLGVAYNGKYAFATISTALTVATASPLPGGTVNRPYSKIFQRINGTAAFTWSKVTGTFPDGLTLNANTGELSGTPTVANQNASFRLRVTDGVNATAEKDFTLAISTAPAITANATLSEATLGLAYSQTVTISGGTAPQTWSKTSGTLPDGVTLNPSTGVLGGTPTVAGTFNFTIQVADANAATASKALSVVVNNALAITKTSPVPAATAGIAYSQTITAVGGTLPLAWTITSGALPAGLNLNTGNGLVSGTTTVSGTANFTVKVADANNASMTRAFAVTVNDAPAITTTALPEGTLSLAYSYQATAVGGTLPRVWSLATGSLPAGLTMSGAGLFSGTPTAAGTVNLALRVTDQNGAVANRALTLTVKAEPQGPDLSAGQTLHSSRCASCHNTTSFQPFAGASKLILDYKGDHRNGAISALTDRSKTNLAFYISSLSGSTNIINGVVKDVANQGLGGVTLTASSGYLPTHTAVTSTNGAYSITGLAPGDYIVQASKSGVTFTPSSVNLAVTKDKYWLAGNVVVTPGVQPYVPPVNFTANQAPAVTLMEPLSRLVNNVTVYDLMSNKAFVDPATIVLTATAADPDGTISGVAFYADGKLIGNGLPRPNSTSFYDLTWPNVAARTNTMITAVAKDNLAVNTTSAPVTIQVLTPVAAPGISLDNGSAIYNLKCSACHGALPGRNPTWAGIAQNYHPGILASRSRYREFDFVAQHRPVISNYFANVITESEKSDLSAYLASSVPERTSMMGTVRNASGQPVPGATVNISSLYNPSVTVASDSMGNYRVEGLFHGDYTVSAAYDGLNPFYPLAYSVNSDPGGSQAVWADRLRTLNIPHQSGTPPVPLDFSPGHRVQGSIRNSNGRGFNGVVVQASALNTGTAADSAISDGYGDFAFVVPDGNYTVAIVQGPFQPQPLLDYTFSPASVNVTVAGTDQSGANFTVDAYPSLTISGTVTNQSGAGMSGVTVSLAEALSVTTTTDINGNYTLTSPNPGTFTVTPAKANHLFTPANQVVTIGVGSRTNVNFTGLLNSFNVTGTVRTRTMFSGPPSFSTIPGEPIANVAVSVPGQTVLTDANGQYRLVLTNNSYTITAARSGYLFDTAPQNITVSGANRAGIDFIAQLRITYASLSGNNNNDGSSWKSAKSSIQKAINITANGGEVWVGGGVYFERISFGGISLYGVNKPVLNGQPLPFGEQFVRGPVVIIDSYNYGGGTNGTRLDGFTIINGLAKSPSPNTGGGINCRATDTEAGPVVIANNTIAGNLAGFKGGGIFLDGKATITNNVVTGNSTEYGPGAGIYCNFGSTLVTIANNLIANNTASEGGGGISTDATSILIANNTIVDNANINAGAGGIYFGSSSGNSTNANNIIAFNSSGIGPANATVTNRYNCIVSNLTANYIGLTSGPGAVSVNPLFVNRAEGNYRLLGASPLINAGDNNLKVGGLDLDGAPRVEGVTVDLGAYEYQTPNAAPEVALTSPVNGASFSTPASFTMNALATDLDGTVTRVDYYAGDSLLGTVTSPPFAFSLNGLQAGVHHLTAVATDNRGAWTVSAPVTVTVHLATDPTVSITSPLDNTRLAAPAQITIQANAADLDGTITKVEFYVNGLKAGEDTVAPYSYTWTNVVSGSYLLTAKATDNSGAFRTSTPLNVTVVNAPQIYQQDTVYTGGEFRLPMKLETGKSYLIQASTNLVTWTTLQAFVAFGNAIEFVDTQAMNYPGRFYRIVQVD